MQPFTGIRAQQQQAEVCQNIIKWCKAEKRTFLRQRVEAKLAFVLYEQEKYSEALTLVDDLLVELKKLDDKQLLVETHLVESKIHHGLRGMAKAKAALTASRTCANAIYVAPTLQSTIDSMSGTLHCEEGDYNTAHSYFLEAFEQLDQGPEVHDALPDIGQPHQGLEAERRGRRRGQIRPVRRRPFGDDLWQAGGQVRREGHRGHVGHRGRRLSSVPQGV